jgi:prepilin-type N-terminal cleavage/methylation domain-containing protein
VRPLVDHVRPLAERRTLSGLIERCRRAFAREDGLTLIELLVTLVILGIVLGAVTGAFMSGTKAEASVANREQAQSDARVALAKMRDDIHCAFAVQSLAANASGGYTLSLSEFGNQCPTVVSQSGSGSTVYLAWCTVPDPAHAGTFDLYRMNGTCDATGTLMAADIVPPAAGWPGNQPGNVWPQSRPCVTGYFNTQAVRLAVNPDTTVPSQRYELTDEIALRNSVRSAPIGCTGAGATAQLVFTIQPAGAVPNAPFPAAPVVTAEDGGGNVVTNYSGTVALSIKAGTGTSGASLTGCSAVNLNGATTFTGCKIDKPGTGYVLVASDGTLSVESSALDVTSGPGASLAVVGYPSPTGAGVSQNFTVTAKDAAGNVATGYTGKVHFTSSDLAATLPADYTFKATDAGTHTFSATLKTLGTQSITATDTATGSLTGSQTGITVNAGPAASFAVVGYSSPTVAGGSHNFTVTAKDALGNVVAGYTGTVHITSTDSAAVLSADAHLTAGVGTFSAVLKTVGTQTITATDTATSSITGSHTPINVTPDTTPPTFAITQSGPNVTTNGTNTVVFNAITGSSFTITAGDPESGIVSTTFPTCPTGWTTSTGTNSVTCKDAALAVGGTMAVSATNGAGATTNLAVTITLDSGVPTNSLTLASSPAPAGSYMAGANGTLFYKQNAASSFSLVNAVSDTGSGPASASFPAISTAGWTHAAETVSTPTGGPYQSSTYSWNAGAGAPGAAPTTFTGSDNAGNTSTTVLAFTPDNASPTGAVTSPTAGAAYRSGTWTGSITGTASDAVGSGVRQVLVSVKDTTSGKCADATGAFTVSGCTTNFVAVSGTTSWSFAEAVGNLTAGHSYTVTVQTTDNVGNSNSNAASATWTYDTTAPTVTSLTLSNGGTAGKVDETDTYKIGFSEGLSVGSICSNWSGDTTDQSLTAGSVVTVTLTDNNPSFSNHDTIQVSVDSGTCGTFHLGTIDLGSNAYISGGNKTFVAAGNGSHTASTISYDATAHTLTVLIGEANGGTGAVATVTSSTATYVPDPAITDSAGNGLLGNFSTGNAKQF